MAEVSSPQLSVVLPNYNGSSLLARNLPLLFAALERAGLPSEVIVVDDASGDDSLALVEDLRRREPTLRAVAKPVNEGFAKTCNRGIEAARGDYICIANTDVEFDPDYFVHALKPLTDGQADIVKGAIVNFSPPPDARTATDRRIKLYLHRGWATASPESKPVRAPYALACKLGCCFVMRARSLRELRGYDEIYSPYYWEDLDLAWRALEAGMRLRYVDEAVVRHQESSTMRALDRQRQARIRGVMTRNRLLLTWRMTRGAGAWLRHAAWHGCYWLSRWIVGDFYYYRAFVEAGSTWRQHRPAALRRAGGVRGG